MALAAEVGAALGQLNVEEATIREIVKILDESANDIDGGHPATVSGGAFGRSPHGADLGHHTSVAHGHVVDAMEHMVRGLHGYVQNVRRFNDDIVFTDETSGDATRGTTNRLVEVAVPTVEQAVACAAPGDVTTTSNDQCTVPTTEDD